MNRGFTRNLKLAGTYALYAFIIMLTYAIVWVDRKIGFPLPFPRNVEALAKMEQWCINVLKENGALPADAVVNAFKVTPLVQSMIFRSNAGIVEIDYSLNGERKTLKCFVKFAPTVGSVWNRTIFNLQLNHIKEASFNNDFVNQDKIAAPRVYYAGVSFNTGNLCLITEYMGDCVEYREGEKEGLPAEYLHLVIENLALLHARYWKDTSERMKKIIPITDGTVDLFDSFVAFKWSIPARKILVKSWCLMNRHETILHGDARIGNMMFPSPDGKGRFVFIDWQAVRKGKAVFDLAYFIVLSLPQKHRRANERQALDAYYNHLITNGVKDYSKEEMEDDYRHACLCLLVLLSLPMLSGEASVEAEGALIFAWGMNIWRERLETKFSEFDYEWLATQYGITEQEGRSAIAEMLKVMADRLKYIAEKGYKS